MVSYDQIIPKDGYLVDEATGEKVVFYECDPAKNTECTNRMCRGGQDTGDDGELGFCSKTPNPKFRKNGGRAFYCVFKEGTYWGREYID